MPFASAPRRETHDDANDDHNVLSAIGRGGGGGGGGGADNTAPVNVVATVLSTVSKVSGWLGFGGGVVDGDASAGEGGAHTTRSTRVPEMEGFKGG